MLSREQRLRRHKKIMEWQKLNPDKMASYQEAYYRHKPKIIKAIPNDVRNRTLKLKDVEIQLRKCYITCIQKTNECKTDLLCYVNKCPGCKWNITYKPEIEIEVKKR